MRAGRPVVWRARQHRKGLGAAAQGTGAPELPVWRRPAYNWIIGACFAVGSLLFMLGSLLSLVPGAIAPPALVTNSIFFLGSIPFTVAGFLQNFQAANAPAVGRRRKPVGEPIALIGWKPKNLGWLSTFAQFIGTVAFNVSTFDAIVARGGWRTQDLDVWTPTMVGSVMFLASGYLAFIEAGHNYWSWRPKDLAWQIGFINLLGCLFFMIAGVLSFVPAGSEPQWIVPVSTIQLMLGALGFFIAALLMMRESRTAGSG